eukprot:g53474.t1
MSLGSTERPKGKGAQSARSLCLPRVDGAYLLFPAVFVTKIKSTVLRAAVFVSRFCSAAVRMVMTVKDAVLLAGSNKQLARILGVSIKEINTCGVNLPVKWERDLKRLNPEWFSYDARLTNFDDD